VLAQGGSLAPLARVVLESGTPVVSV